jgi:hypothetical protein
MKFYFERKFKNIEQICSFEGWKVKVTKFENIKLCDTSWVVCAGFIMGNALYTELSMCQLKPRMSICHC